MHRAASKIIPALGLAALLVALTVYAQEAPPAGDAPATREAPVAGPAPVPAVPGALPAGTPALPKRVDPSTLPGGGLKVVIGPISRTLDPIAVPETMCSKGEKGVCQLITEVVRNDLRLSGYFDILPPRSYIADPAKESLTLTQWPDWINVGATYLVKAELRGDGPYDVSFRLYNVVDKRAYSFPKQERKGLSREQLRRAVHDFCNEIVNLVSGTPGPFGTRILYAVKTSLQTKGIAVIDMDGHDPHSVIAGSSIAMLPSWAPGGGVLHTSFRGGRPAIYLGKKRLSKGGYEYRGARFSPDGSVIAVSVQRDEQADIWLMSPSGELQTNLTKHWADEVSPRWSPDGSQIAFVSNRTGGPQIYVMNRDGSGQRRLTMAGSYNSTPDWGKNGLIVFAGLTEGHSDIFTVDLGGQITRLTQDQGNNRDPSWSPNGRYIAFTSDRDGGGGHIWIMTADGRYQFRISENGGCSTPAWQH